MHSEPPNSGPAVKNFPDAETVSRELATQIAGTLAAATGTRGLASLVVSGGHSPVRMFEILRAQSLDWSRVCVALADERWVSPEDAESNERLVRDVLLKDQAASARFLGLKNGAPTPDLGAVSAWETFARVPRPFDAVILGMGDDGHTASLFPRSPNLPSALNSCRRRRMHWHVVSRGATTSVEPELDGIARFAAHRGADHRRSKAADL